MILASLQIGWGNTSAIFALALLPIVLISGVGPKPAGQEQTKIERQQLVLVGHPASDFTPSTD
jgi:hypothetical protein